MDKKLFSTRINMQYLDVALLLVRVAVSLLMLTHGLKKTHKLWGPDPITFSDPIGVGPIASYYLTLFAEVICAVLVMIGLLTRLACLPILITMAVAAFVVHMSDGLAKQELALLYLCCYFLIWVAGPGKYSLDRWLTGAK